MFREMDIGFQIWFLKNKRVDVVCEVMVTLSATPKKLLRIVGEFSICFLYFGSRRMNSAISRT